MTLAAFNGRPRITFMVPVAGCPVVVLVLQLHPPNAIDFLIDELLVAGAAILGLLVHAFAEAIMLRRPRANQEIASDGTNRVLRAPLPQILLRLDHRVIGITLQVRFLNGVARKAGDAFVVALKAGEFLDEDVLCSRKKRDGVVATAAIARRLGPVLLRHHRLNALENRIHGGVAMRAGLPFAV